MMTFWQSVGRMILADYKLQPGKLPSPLGLFFVVLSLSPQLVVSVVDTAGLAASSLKLRGFKRGSGE